MHFHVGRLRRLLEAMMRRSRARSAAFTLIELMVVVALIAVILVLAAPSFRDMILMQRLRGINAQVVADLAYARSEAISRDTFVQVRFQTSTTSTPPMTCYIIFSRLNRNDTPQCDCTAAVGSRCADPSTVEVRTAQMPTSDSVIVAPQTAGLDFYTIDPRTGGLVLPAVDDPNIPVDRFPIRAYIDPSREFVDVVGLSGRIKVCAPTLSTVGAGPC